MNSSANNAVKAAVKKAGGATVVARALGITTEAVYQWIRNEHVPRTEYALWLADRGKTPIARLSRPLEGNGAAS